MKKGFTLAEVLITLGIIGVVAALTMPSLNLNVSTSKVYPSLQKAMNTLQTATDLVMAENQDMTFAEVCGLDMSKLFMRGGANPRAVVQGHLLNILGPKMRVTIEEMPKDTAYQYCTNGTCDAESTFFTKRGSNGQISEVNSGHALVTKDGMAFVSSGASNGMLNVIADINGYGKGPNIFGVDAFMLAINPSSGDVYALGSKEYNKAANDIIAQNSSDEEEDEDDEGEDENVSSYNWDNGGCDRNSVSDPYSCSGSVIDNGKIIYNYNTLSSSATATITVPSVDTGSGRY